MRRSYSSGSRHEEAKGATGDDMLNEDDAAVAAEERDAHMAPFALLKDSYQCPKLPIVFCHGLFGFDVIGPAGFKPLQVSYWVGVEDALRKIGVDVLIARVPASASIEERAKVLCELIDRTFPGRDIALVGHSMGGLDGRFLISRLRPTKFKVRALVTIATPHRGSSFADYVLEELLGTERVPSMLSMMESVGVPGGGKAFNDLTTCVLSLSASFSLADRGACSGKMKRFNEETPDDPDVQYFSYGAEFEPGWSNVFRTSWKVIHDRGASRRSFRTASS